MSEVVTAYGGLIRRAQIRLLRQVADRALPLFEIEPVSLSILAHSFNTTFKVTGQDGTRFVLHILRPIEALSSSQGRVRVESELWWLDEVRRDLNIGVPVPVRTPTGEGVVSIAVEVTDSPLLCTLFHWMDGRFLRHRLGPAHLKAVGRLTAQLHRHSARLAVPEGFDRPTVDEAGKETEEDVADLFTDHVSTAAGEVLRRVFQRVRRVQEELGTGRDTFGLIHADIHQRNYLFQNGEVRLIDFGDCGWGHYLYDLAVTVSELAGLPQYPELRAALLVGYRQIRDLSPQHEALIDTFVMLREAQNVTWFLHERDDPSWKHWTLQIGDRVATLERMLISGS